MVRCTLAEGVQTVCTMYRAMISVDGLEGHLALPWLGYGDNLSFSPHGWNSAGLIDGSEERGTPSFAFRA